MSKRLLLTAGFDRSPHVIAMAELLRRAGHRVAGVIVVSPYGARRARRLIAQHGRSFPLRAARRLLGRPAAGREDPLQRFLAERQIAHRSLRAWCREHGVPRTSVADLNSNRGVAAIREAEADGILYGGGGILHEGAIEAARGRILNAHHGRMPEIRGMNACEWSLLLDVPTEVTIHVIDRGIDTGPILERIPLEVRPGDDIETLRSRCTVLGVEGLVRNAARIDDLPPPRTDAGAARSLQCFVLAPALRELLEARLARRRPGAMRG